MKRLMILPVSVGSLVIAGQAAANESVDFTIDPTQSSVTLDVDVNAGLVSASDDGASALSGTLTADLGSVSDPFGTATITDLAITLDDGVSLSFNLLVASVAATTTDGGVTFTQVSPGSTDNPVDGAGVFDQLGNDVSGAGSITTDVAGAIDLASAGTVTVDYDDVTITRVGDVLTLSAPISGVIPQQSFDVSILTATVDATVSGTFVATATIPEPGSLALLGLGGLALVRRRRS